MAAGCSRSVIAARLVRASTLLLIATLHTAALFAQSPVTGWRGNWNGVWPNTQTPREWHRLPRGTLNELRATAQRPAENAPAAGEPVLDGVVLPWMVCGPLLVKNSKEEFAQEQLPGEANLSPLDGDAAGPVKWHPLAVQLYDRYELGPAELPWLNLGKDITSAANQVGYAVTWLHVPRGGPARIVVDHANGLAVWLNGSEVYRHAERGAGLGFYTAISGNHLKHLRPKSPAFDIELKPGWNRLVCKLSTYHLDGWNEMQFSMRIIERSDVQYDQKNIAWMTPLPDKSNATPILVGDKLFVMSEPDLLLCLDKQSGKILWSAAHSYFDATPDSERAANPAFQPLAELAAQLPQTNDPDRRAELHRQMQEQLLAIDKEKFAYDNNDHFEAHFGIIGFTTPTPCSDGERVYVWCGNGVAACYDLEGKRQWITRLDTGHLSYPSSPALIGDRFVVFMNRLYGLDKKTGEVVWKQPRVNKNNAAIQPAKIAGVEVVVTQQGEIIRADDGKMLFKNGNKSTSDSGWAAPVIAGDIVYQPWYGVTNLQVLDFSAAAGDEWETKSEMISDIAISRRPNGGWLDRWMAASPLLHDGLIYAIDIYGCGYCIDPALKQTLYRQDLDGLRGYFHYNSIPVAASPALAGGLIYMLDNQGNTAVLQPGRELKQVAHNKLATQIDRIWPINPQETTSYAPPIADGRRLYIRGEQFLYCIEEQ